MFSLTMARQLITQGAYMAASMDLKDAYYYILIASEHRKYLWFVGLYMNIHVFQMVWHFAHASLRIC